MKKGWREIHETRRTGIGNCCSDHRRNCGTRRLALQERPQVLATKCSSLQYGTALALRHQEGTIEPMSGPLLFKPRTV